MMLWNYARFDFGKSYFRDVTVLQLIKEKLPVSMSLGIWMTLLTYLISIPLGIRKAIDDGSRFDMWTSSDHHHRLRHSRLPVRDPADHPVRRRLVLRLVPVARAGVGEFLVSCPGTADPRLFLAPDAADPVDGAVGLRHDDAADQELVPRGNPQAVCAHRARQGLHAQPGAVRPRLPQRHADRDRRLSRRLRVTPSSPARC